MDLYLCAEEKEAIVSYKAAHAKLPNGSRIIHLMLPDYTGDKDDIHALDEYLDAGKAHCKQLTLAAQLRQEHFLRFIKGCREEDEAHRIYREAITYAAETSASILDHWQIQRDVFWNNALKANTPAKISEAKQYLLYTPNLAQQQDTPHQQGDQRLFNPIIRKRIQNKIKRQRRKRKRKQDHKLLSHVIAMPQNNVPRKKFALSDQQQLLKHFLERFDDPTYTMVRESNSTLLMPNFQQEWHLVAPVIQKYIDLVLDYGMDNPQYHVWEAAKPTVQSVRIRELLTLTSMSKAFCAISMQQLAPLALKHRLCAHISSPFLVWWCTAARVTGELKMDDIVESFLTTPAQRRYYEASKAAGIYTSTYSIFRNISFLLDRNRPDAVAVQWESFLKWEKGMKDANPKRKQYKSHPLVVEAREAYKIFLRGIKPNVQNSVDKQNHKQHKAIKLL